MRPHGQQSEEDGSASNDFSDFNAKIFARVGIFQGTRIATSEFQNAPPEQQQLLLGQTITGVLANYQTVLNELLVTAPDAQILLPNYYNPYPDFVPEGPLYDSILASFNPAVEQLANAYGASYVDFYSVFEGRALELTNIGFGDVHPNQLGYQAAGNAMISAVPEPSAAVACGGLFLAGVFFGRRRRGAELPSSLLAA